MELRVEAEIKCVKEGNAEEHLHNDAYVDWMRKQAFARKGAHGERLIWEYATEYYPQTWQKLEKTVPKLSAQLESMALQDLLPIHMVQRFLPDPLTVYRQQYHGVLRNDLRKEEPHLYLLLKKIGALHRIPEERTMTDSGTERADAAIAKGLRWAEAVAPSGIVREYRYGIQLIMRNSPQEAKKRIEDLMHFALRERKHSRCADHTLVSNAEHGWRIPVIKEMRQNAGSYIEEDFGAGAVATRECAFEDLIHARLELGIQSQPAGLSAILRPQE